MTDDAKEPKSSPTDRIAAALPPWLVDPLPDLIWQGLLKRYGEPHRRYHDLVHLAEVLETARRFDIEGSPEFYFAVLYHDVIYDPRRDDNEERSARLLVDELGGLGGLLFDVGSGSRACDLRRAATLVRTTAHHASDVRFDDREAEALLDCDGAILGASRQRYAQYSAAVRAEYGHLPAAHYNTGRSAFLRQLLRLPQLFHRADFRLALTDRARSNLQWELSQLGAG